MMRQKRSLIALLLALLSLQASAQTQWVKKWNNPSGASIIGLTAASGIVYALSSNSEIYYSLDSGSVWTSLPGTQGYWNTDAILANGGRLYANSSIEGLLFTDNLGQTWQNRPFYTNPITGFHASIETIGANGAQSICNETFDLATQTCVGYITSNGWATWQNVNLPFRFAYQYQYTSDGLLYAGTDNGLRVSANNGATWSWPGGSLPGKLVAALAVTGGANYNIFAGVRFNVAANDTSGCGVYFSSDKGISWQLRSNGIGSRPIKSLVYDTTSHALFALGQDSLYRSLDEGLTWTLLPTPLIHRSVFNIIAPRQGYLFASSPAFGVVGVPTSGPATGTTFNTGILAAHINSFEVLNDSIWATDAGGGGIRHVYPGAADWLMDLPITDRAFLTGGEIVKNGRGALLGAISGPTNLFCKASSQSPWVRISANIPAPPNTNGMIFRNFTAAPTNPSSFYLIVDYSGPGLPYRHALLKSDNNGQSWTTIKQTSASVSDFYKVCIASNNKIYYLAPAGAGKGIYATDSVGNGWTLVSSGISQSDSKAGIYANNSGDLYLITYNNITRMDINGNWTSIANGGWSPGSLELKLYFSPRDSMVLTSNPDGAFYSSDKGGHWSNISAGLPYINTGAGLERLALKQVRFTGPNDQPVGIGDNLSSDGSQRGIYYLINQTATALPTGIGGTSQVFQVYPNPFRGSFQFEFSARRSQTVQLKLFDATGREVLNRMMSATAGTNRVRVACPGLAAGVYLISFQCDGAAVAGKIIAR